MLLGFFVLAAVKQLANNWAKQPNGEHQQIHADEADVPTHDNEWVLTLQGLPHISEVGDALEEHHVDSNRESADFDSHEDYLDDGADDVEHSYFSFMKFLTPIRSAAGR